MAEKYVMVDLDDSRIDSIADAISNKTAKKIVALLSEEEMSEWEIARKLGLPLNTIDYNVKKLTKAGLIEPVKGFFWSSKGKRILSYRVSNKKIVISPRSIIRGVVPAVLLSVLGALALRYFLSASYVANETLSKAPLYADQASEIERSVGSVGSEVLSAGAASSIWLWFLFGALFALIILLAWNWRKY